MSGYQEIISDPSYARQIVTFTFPHIGIIGANDDDIESARVFATGVIVRDYAARPSSWRSRGTLSDYLRRHGAVGAADVDTRRLTRHLRTHGVLRGVLYTGDVDASAAENALAGFPGLTGADVAQLVSTRRAYQWDKGTLHPGQAAGPVRTREELSVVAYDFGVKHNILRMLVDSGCKVTVVPARTPVSEVLALNPGGVFLSNGPGDPEPCDYAIAAIRELLEMKKPLFGICLGHQLLCLACGARSVKMKFGHHGANHPVQDLSNKRVFITSQNHNFCIDEDSLPDTLQVTHRSLFDGTLQGVRHVNGSAFGFQGHPEASPGPHDITPLFSAFTQLIRTRAEIR